jgi:lipopolysaccharide transport system permease protein
MGLFSGLQELLRYRELLLSWVQRNKVRAKQSLLGVLWAIIQPLSATVIFAVIFSRFVRVPTAVEEPGHRTYASLRQ